MTEDKKMPETWLEAMRGEPDQRRLVGLPRPPTLEEALCKLVERYKAEILAERAKYDGKSGMLGVAFREEIKLSFAEDLLAELRG